jgi:hypothetical protein
MKMSRCVSVALAAGLLPGCACIVSGFASRETVTITTEPGGALVRAQGASIEACGESRWLVEKSGSPVQLVIEKDGYRPAAATIDSSLSPWAPIGWLAWGLIGVCIDLATGCGYDMTERVNVTLEPDPTYVAPRTAERMLTQQLTMSADDLAHIRAERARKEEERSRSARTYNEENRDRYGTWK